LTGKVYEYAVCAFPLWVALAFARDMEAFFKAETQLEQDEIASRQLHAVQAF
jgi:hypothetical protein